jgi:hypothetical protein
VGRYFLKMKAEMRVRLYKLKTTKDSQQTIGSQETGTDQVFFTLFRKNQTPVLWSHHVPRCEPRAQGSLSKPEEVGSSHESLLTLTIDLTPVSWAMFNQVSGKEVPQADLRATSRKLESVIKFLYSMVLAT